MTDEEKFKAKMEFDSLQPNAKEVLGQLFLYGPTYDGHVASKVGRDLLYDLKLIERGEGWQWLTRDGVIIALYADVGTWFEGRWRTKQCS